MSDIWVPHMLGLDVGFRKTGYSVFEIGKVNDELIFANTLVQEKDESKVTSSVQKDLFAIYDLLDGLDKVFAKWKPSAVFCEIPSAGSQGARAGRCMGIATGLLVSYLRYRNVKYELFTPSEVELNLGVKLTAQAAKKRGVRRALAAQGGGGGRSQSTGGGAEPGVEAGAVKAWAKRAQSV